MAECERCRRLYRELDPVAEALVDYHPESRLDPAVIDNLASMVQVEEPVTAIAPPFPAPDIEDWLLSKVHPVSVAVAPDSTARPPPDP